MRSRLFGAATTFLLCAAALLAPGNIARAEVETMTPTTPTVVGGQVVGSGHMVIGASTGFPGLRGHFLFGLGSSFDLAIEPQFTWANGWLSGLNQGIGAQVEVPMRIQLITSSRFAMNLRLIPYVRVGRAAPSWGTGGTIGVRASIPLKKLFSIIVGLETRGGFGSFHSRGCAGTSADCNDSYFEGATYVDFGLETYFRQAWYFFATHDLGAAYTSGGGYWGWNNGCFDANGNPESCGGNAHAYFRAQFGFGYQIR